jgi:NADH-quinone oxidoreductase subunit D
MPRLLRPAAGEVYMHCEDPRGEYGVYIVSKGTTQPYRVHIRSASFCNLSALRHMTIGSYLADSVTILGSTDIVLCSVDR